MTAWDIPKRTVARTMRKARVVRKLQGDAHALYEQRLKQARQQGGAQGDDEVG